MLIYLGGELEEAERCMEMVVQEQTFTDCAGLEVSLVVEVMAEE